jgi:hypothetical protein
VAGYRAWQAMGRQVRRGERGIKILVPMPVRGRDRAEPTEPAIRPEASAPDDQIGDPATDRRGRLRFGVGAVSDIGQTEGEPLPTIDVPVLIGDEGDALYARMERLAHDEGLPVRRGSPRLVRPETMGFYSPTERLIVVREASSRQMTKTLAHELAHHFGDAVAPSAEEETIAESVAYVVCAHAGLDTGERSFPYVATWSRDSRLFRGALARIGGLSRHLIARVEYHDADRMLGAGEDRRATEPQAPPSPDPVLDLPP